MWFYNTSFVSRVPALFIWMRIRLWLNILRAVKCEKYWNRHIGTLITVWLRSCFICFEKEQMRKGTQ